jgi:uncharacterized coiled-coil DUF342 family protein
MSLKTAISNNVISLAQAQKTYKENVVTVNTLISSVLSSKLPTLHENPPDWNEFATAYEAANSDALDWVNNVMARLLNVPDEVQSYNNIISQLLLDAKSQAMILVKNPGDKNTLTILHNDLRSVSTQLNIVTTFISGAVTNIQKFKDKLPDMANQLQAIADKSSKDANADEQKIKQLQEDINQLNAEIKSLTASIVALGIADAAAITLGIVATIAAFPVGAVAWLFAAPAIAVATTYIVLDAEKIKADQEKINADKDSIDELTADVSTLHLLAQNYHNMATEAAALEENLQAILNEWLSLESDVDAAVTDIQTATSDADAAQFEAVVDDITNAIEEWGDAYKQAGELNLDLKASDAKLEIGMSSDEVQAAIAQGTSMDIIDYYNNVA